MSRRFPFISNIVKLTEFIALGFSLFVSVCLSNRFLPRPQQPITALKLHCMYTTIHQFIIINLKQHVCVCVGLLLYILAYYVGNDTELPDNNCQTFPFFSVHVRESYVGEPIGIFINYIATLENVWHCQLCRDGIRFFPVCIFSHLEYVEWAKWKGKRRRNFFLEKWATRLSSRQLPAPFHFCQRHIQHNTVYSCPPRHFVAPFSWIIFMIGIGEPVPPY
jgi:hypothetical protein